MLKSSKKRTTDFCLSKMPGITLKTAHQNPTAYFPSSSRSVLKPAFILIVFLQHIQKFYTIRKPESNFEFEASQFTQSKFSFKFSISKLNTLYEENEKLAERGGRLVGLKGLEKIKNKKDYNETRNFMHLKAGTTKMSAHLKFGTVSIREMYWRIAELFGETHDLIRQLVFRDFYLKIYSHNPELQRGIALQKGVDERIPWSDDEKLWAAWCEGKTGFPLVDAAQRQLKEIGWQVRFNYCYNSQSPNSA